MHAYLQYLLKSSLCILPFYGVYLLLLRRLTFFGWNRIYLLGSLLISLVIPLLKVNPPPVVQPYTQVIPVFMNNGVSGTITPSSAYATTAVSHVNWMQAIMWIYIIGGAVLMIKLLGSLWQVYRLISEGQKKRADGFIIICNEKIRLNASFFHYIFLQPHLSDSEVVPILAHEHIHAEKWHSMDILLMEMLKVIFWFHPIVYHYKLLLQRAHEFEVDNKMLLHTDKKEYAQLLLNLQLPRYLSVVNLFSSSELKERILMLFAPKSNTMKRLFYLSLVPLILILVMSFSIKKKDKQGLQGNESRLDTTIYANRTLKSTWNLGENPLVLINGKEYPAGILTKINPYKIKASTIMRPNNETDLKKYGQKARDGVVKLEAKDNFLSMTVQERKNLEKENSIPAGQFFTRLTLKDNSGKEYDKIIIQSPDGGGGSMTINDKGGKVRYFIDGKERTEEEIKALDINVQRSIKTWSFSGADEIPGAMGEKEKGVEGVIWLYINKKEPAHAVKYTSPAHGITSIELNDVKRIKVDVTSGEEVQKMFGSPSQISMNPHQEALAYKRANIFLGILIDPDKNVVKDYSFKTKNNTPGDLSINIQDVKKIKLGSTNLSDIKNIFGLPDEIDLHPHNESWTYKAKNGLLSIMFDNNSDEKVTDYNFKTGE